MLENAISQLLAVLKIRNHAFEDDKDDDVDVDVDDDDVMCGRRLTPRKRILQIAVRFAFLTLNLDSLAVKSIFDLVQKTVLWIMVFRICFGS